MAEADALSDADKYTQLAENLPTSVAPCQQLLDKMETLQTMMNTMDTTLESVKKDLQDVKEHLRAATLQALLREQWAQARGVNCKRYIAANAKLEPLKTLPDLPQLEPGQRAVPPDLGPAPRDFPHDKAAAYKMPLAACKRLLMAYNQPSPPEDVDSAREAVLAFIGCTQDP